MDHMKITKAVNLQEEPSSPHIQAMETNSWRLEQRDYNSFWENVFAMASAEINPKNEQHS